MLAEEQCNVKLVCATTEAPPEEKIRLLWERTQGRPFLPFEAVWRELLSWVAAASEQERPSCVTTYYCVHSSSIA